MYLGVVYNIFVCCVCSLMGFIIFSSLQKLRDKNKVNFSKNIDYFVLLLGFLWFFVAVRNFMALLGNINLETNLYKWIIGPLTFLHLIPAYYYFGWAFFGNKKIKFLFNGLFTLISLITVYTFFKYGFTRPALTYWGSNVTPNKLTNQIFTFGLFVPAVPFILIELFRRFKKLEEDTRQRRLLGFAFGFLVYALGGALQVSFFTQGWPMLLSRIVAMLGPLIFYLSATWYL